MAAKPIYKVLFVNQGKVYEIYARRVSQTGALFGFVEVEEVVDKGDNRRIFSGWMFAESPGLNAVEHPVFDVWLTDCATATRPVAEQKPQPKGGAPAPIAKGGQPATGQQSPELGPALSEEPVRRDVGGLHGRDQDVE